MPHYTAKVDANHAEIVDALRSVGAQVQSLASVGAGCPDILAAFRGEWFVLEVKDGSKPASHRKLTQPEARWHEQFQDYATVWTVTSVDEALAAIGAV